MAEIRTAKPADAIDETDEDVAADDAAGVTPGDTATADATEVAAPDGGDDGNDLLNMFTEVGIETVDRTVLTNLAGEVDMVDLIAELNVVAAAMGIVRAEHDAQVHEQEQQLAA